MGRAERVKNTRLGLSFGSRRIGEGGRPGAAWGWAIVGTKPNSPERTKRGDPLTLAREAAINWNTGSHGPFTIFVYESDESYRGSQGHLAGLNRMEHWLQVNEIADSLASEGFNITIMEVS